MFKLKRQNEDVWFDNRYGVNIQISSKKMFFKGKAGFLCKHCYADLLADIDYKSFVKPYSPYELYIQSNISFTIRCPYCDHVFEWIGTPIDPNIVHSLSRLNRKGYYTVTSSEGSLFDISYITFRNNMHRINKKYPLPWPWKVDNESAYLKATNLFRISTQNSICTKKTKINSLESWIDTLPAIHNSIWDRELRKLQEENNNEN